MNDEQQQFDDDLGEHYLEHALLLAVGALLSSANSVATEKGGGFRFVPDDLRLTWPDEVQLTMGFKQNKTLVVHEEDGFYRLLFEPCDVGTGHSYWSLLFPNTAPSLVFEYVVDVDDDNAIVPTLDSWLVWPWHVGHSGKATSLGNALAAQTRLEAEIDWLKATKASVHEKRPALFDAVAAYCEREV